MAGITPDETNTTEHDEDLAVPFTAHLNKTDLSDADAHGETDISDDGTNSEEESHDHSLGAVGSEPVTEGAKGRQSLPEPHRRPFLSDRGRRSTTDHRRLPEAVQSTARESQPHIHRAHGPGPRLIGRPRKPSSSPPPHRRSGAVQARTPTAEERHAAREKAERLAQELHFTWHSRASKTAKRAEINRLNKIAAGGYIDAFLEQESPQEVRQRKRPGGYIDASFEQEFPLEEVHKRKRCGVKPPAHGQMEEDIDESGWAPGERERFWAKITKGRKIEEPEIDLAGNIISRHPAVENTEDWGADEGVEQHGEFGGDFAQPPAYFGAVGGVDEEPMRPPKKRRSAHDAPRESVPRR
ncbi:MAG: hypothetical protein Q9200_001257 [Gallowayella weberi]